jgi:hypothetical protein
MLKDTLLFTVSDVAARLSADVRWSTDKSDQGDMIEAIRIRCLTRRFDRRWTKRRGEVVKY